MAGLSRPFYKTLSGNALACLAGIYNTSEAFAFGKRPLQVVKLWTNPPGLDGLTSKNKAYETMQPNPYPKSAHSKKKENHRVRWLKKQRFRRETDQTKAVIRLNLNSLIN